MYGKTVVSPQLAFLGRVHVGALRTPEVVAEVFHVGERAVDPETDRRMFVIFDHILVVFHMILGAPHIGVAQPEYLLRRVLLEPGQLRFDAMSFDPLSVRVICYFQASIV